MTPRVLGIGGIFFKARDPEALRAWYHEHLGLAITDWGGVVFEPMAISPAGRSGTLVWNIFPADTGYFEPSVSPFMINYRVDDLDQVLAALRAEGCDVDPGVESSEYGRFGWVSDPESNRLELWEPPRVQPTTGLACLPRSTFLEGASLRWLIQILPMPCQRASN